MSNIRVQIIGNYLENIAIFLSQNNVYVESMIGNCNPLAMVGSCEPKYEKYCEKINDKVNSLNIRKNLGAMLSRDPDLFCDNQIFSNYSEEKRYKNTSDYIILSNTNLMYKLYYLEGSVYSNIWPRNAFIDDLLNNPATAAINITSDNFFNWEYYFNLYIDEIMKNYSNDRIILIKYNVSDWYMDKGAAEAFDNVAKVRKLIRRADEIFIKRTNCIVINDAEYTIPDKKNKGAAPSMRVSKNFDRIISSKILDILKDSEAHRSINREYYSPLAGFIFNRIDKEVFGRIEKFVSSAEDMRIFDIDRKHLDLCEVGEEGALLKAIFDVYSEFNISGECRFSTYFLNRRKNGKSIDLHNTENYFKYYNIDINDIIALMKFSEEYDESSKIIRSCVASIFDKKDGVISYAKAHVRNNISYLKNYEYISRELKLSLEGRNDAEIWFRLENNYFIVLNNSSEHEPVRMEYIEKQKADAEKLLQGEISFNIKEASSIISDLAFYVYRAKHNMGDKPISVIFNNVDEFYTSLSYIDYEDILKNEHFILKLNNESFDLQSFSNVTDLSFLFRKTTKIVYVRSGLADQLCYYFFAKRLEAKGYDVYYDDIYFYSHKAFNGLELDKFNPDPNFKNKLITNKLSDSLKQLFVKEEHIADLLYENGLTSLACVSNDTGRLNLFKKCIKIYYPAYPHMDLDGLFDDSISFAPSYYAVFMRPEWLIKYKNFELSEDFRFPELTDEVNLSIAESIQSCDSVAIHVRRGDFVTWGWDADLDFYRESLEKLSVIKDYKNIRFFVFSDDIPWCKNNIDKLITDILTDADITYVDNNKGKQSYIDMQLMSMTKIIIGSNSGFVRMAALLNRNCELFLCYNLSTMKLFEKIGKINKYDVGSYSKAYGTDYSSKSPKK